MKNSEEMPNESMMETLSKQVNVSRDAIENEFVNTPNPWWACVNTRLHVFMGYVDLALDDGEISEIERDGFMNKIIYLSDEINNISVQYPNKEDEIPNEIKESILKRLNIFSEV